MHQTHFFVWVLGYKADEQRWDVFDLVSGFVEAAHAEKALSA